MTEKAKIQVRKRRKQLSRKRRNFRLLLLGLVLFVGSGALLFHKDKLYTLNELFNGLQYDGPGEVKAHTLSSSVRGDIYDRNFRPLAATYKTYAIYARPLEMEDPDSSAEILAEILGLEKNTLIQNLKGERGFIWVAKGIDDGIAGTIKQRNIKGVYQVVETKRFYPNLKKAAHVVGFVENDQGLDGVEFQYNTILRGDETSSAELKSLNFAPETEFEETSTHLVLNIDLVIQSKIERFLNKRMQITGASSGTAILMNADTGAVLALASLPSFNPNRYWEFSSSDLKNNALAEPVYPGDLALIFQQAAAFNLQNEKKPESTDNLDKTNQVTIITPEKRKRRKLSVAPRVDYVHPEYLAEFTQLLGFDQKPLTDLPLKDEIPGSSILKINSPSFNSSALRLLTGFTALVNGGRLVTPHLLHRAYQKNKTSHFETTITTSKQEVVLNPDTTKDLTGFLATRWLKLGRRNRTDNSSMFFEAHRFSTPANNALNNAPTAKKNAQEGQIPYVSQTVMLGSIPGKETKLTMIAVLSYPENCDGIYPDALEAFGNKFSILSPDKKMIETILHVAATPPPNPSRDFWSNAGSLYVKKSNSYSHENAGSTELADNSVKNMPDVTGKSLRAGLQVLQHLNLDIKLVGSGRIVSQQPPAGAELTKVGKCTLQLQQEI